MKHRLNLLFLAVITCLPALASQQLPAFNDSARFHLERGNTKAARAWVEKALKANASTVYTSMSYAISGMIREEEGFLTDALKDYETGYRLAAENQASNSKAASLNGIASIFNVTGRYDSVLTYLEQSRKLDPSIPNLITTYLVEGRYWQSQNDYDKCLEVFQHMLDYAEKVNDRRNIAIALSNIGGIYFSHNPDMSHALGFYVRSNEQCDSLLHANILARNYGRMANAYMVLGNLREAERFLTRARKIVDISGNLPVRAYILSSWATYYSEVGKYDQAIEASEEPIRIRRELGQARQLQNDLLNIAEMYMMVKQYDKAKSALREGIQISRSLHDIVYMKYYYDRQAMLDSLTGNYRGAYTNLKLSMAYKDSTFSAQHLRDVREIQEKYESEQKEKTIAEKELQIGKQKYQQALIIGTSVIAILVLVVVLIIIRNNSRQRLVLEREHQHQLRLETIVKTQEEVQQRIARDLHDGLVQVLGAAKMSLQAARPDSDKAVLREYIRNSSEILDEAVAEARSISHELLPYSLLKDGLVSALEELFARGLPSYQFTHDDVTPPITENTGINIYRIVQELVNNVQKHSGATSVIISLTVAAGKLRFVFTDNGKGFDTKDIKSGAGLFNLATRAELLGGSIAISSTPGKGTSTELNVPL